MSFAATYFPAEQLGEEDPLPKLQPLHCTSYMWISMAFQEKQDPMFP